MNAKTQVTLEVTKGEHTFSFVMPLGCPLGVAYDACFEALRDIVELSKQAVEQVKQVPETEEKVSTES